MYFILRLLILSLLLPASAAFAASAGRVQFAMGEVSVESSDGARRSLKKGDSIEEGDAVITGATGRAQLLMSDEAIVAVRPGTRLRFETYRYSGKDDGSEQSLMALLRGSFRSITGFIGRLKPKAYRITTPTATIGIRGTDHEPLYIPPPAPGETPIGPPGTYDKVNSGQTFIENASGRIEIGPNQAGFAPPTPNIAPIRLPKIPAFMRASPTEGQGGDKRGPRDGEQRQGKKGEADKPDQKKGSDEKPAGKGPNGPAPGGSSQPGGPQGGAPDSGPEGRPGSGGLLPPGGIPNGPVPEGMQAPRPGGLPAPGGLPLPGFVPPPLPPPIQGTLDLSNPPSGFVAAPYGFAVTGGDLSGSAVGSGAGVVGNDFGLALDASGNVLSVGSSSFSYATSGAALVHKGGASAGGLPVRWGIYAGGQISDNHGIRNPSFFHFMGAPNATSLAVIKPLLTAGGPMTFTAVAGNNEYTKPIAENGALGGTVGLSITLNNVSSTPSVTAYSISVTDAKARSWSGSLSGGPVGLGNFLSGTGAPLSVGCTGCAVTSGTGSAHGTAIGTSSIQGVISSYDLKAGSAGVTGSVLAR